MEYWSVQDFILDRAANSNVHLVDLSDTHSELQGEYHGELRAVDLSGTLGKRAESFPCM